MQPNFPVFPIYYGKILLYLRKLSFNFLDQLLKRLLKQRDPIYHKFADIEVVTGVKPFEELIKEIEEQLP